MLLKLHVYIADIQYFNHYDLKTECGVTPLFMYDIYHKCYQKNLKGQHLP